MTLCSNALFRMIRSELKTCCTRKAAAASRISGNNLSGWFARTTSSMIHFVAAGKTITISVLTIAQLNVPAAIHGYRLRYEKTRQTVLMPHEPRRAGYGVKVEAVDIQSVVEFVRIARSTFETHCRLSSRCLILRDG